MLTFGKIFFLFFFSSWHNINVYLPPVESSFCAFKKPPPELSQPKQILRNVDGMVRPGELLAIMGKLADYLSYFFCRFFAVIRCGFHMLTPRSVVECEKCTFCPVQINRVCMCFARGKWSRQDNSAQYAQWVRVENVFFARRFCHLQCISLTQFILKYLFMLRFHSRNRGNLKLEGTISINGRKIGKAITSISAYVQQVDQK